MIEFYFYYALIGIVAGILAGLFGVGGGLVIVPALYYLFSLQQISTQVAMHIAVGTSLATIILTSISSSYSHYKHQAILGKVFLLLSPGLMLGAFLSGFVANSLKNDYLVIIFAIFEIMVAIQMGFALKVTAHRQLPKPAAIGAAGSVIGLISGLVGIGGGTLTVPYLSWHNIEIKKAIGTSAACGFSIAIGGMAGFLVSGLNNENLPRYSTGYILWPAFVGISLFSVLCAPFGARLAHRIPSQKLKRGFAIFLAIIGIQMIYKLTIT